MANSSIAPPRQPQHQQFHAIVKIGGSLITYADAALNRVRMADIARQLLLLDRPTVLVHGSGTVGRKVLTHYGMKSDFASPHEIEAVVSFRSEVKRLNHEFVGVLRDAGLNCAAFLPHTFLRSNAGQLSDPLSPKIIAEFMLHRVVVLSGDALDDDKHQYYFCSGDQIVAYLARELRPLGVVFLTNVDGVYEPYPPLMPTDSPLREVGKFFLENASYDYVVGGTDMIYKVRQAIASAQHASFCYIANGTVEGILIAVLSQDGLDDLNCTRVVC